MSSDSHDTSRQWQGNGEPSARSTSTQFTSRTLPPLPSDNPRPAPRLRLPGDGFDFRRPIMSQPQPAHPPNEVIDLTAEPDTPPDEDPPRRYTRRPSPAAHSRRPPRFGREIMDVIDLEAEDSDVPPRPPAVRLSESPEIQFVASRPRSPELDQQRGAGNTLRVLDRQLPAPAGNTGVRTQVHGAHLANMFHRAGQTEGVALIRREFNRRRPILLDPVLRFLGGAPIEEGQGMPLPSVPDMMDYEATGFTFGREERSPSPTIFKAPSPVPEGFTRSPREEDVLVCPNCDHELGTGDGLKKQVFIAKKCGHVSGTILL